jgi:hypothetical protein
VNRPLTLASVSQQETPIYITAAGRSTTTLDRSLAKREK